MVPSGGPERVFSRFPGNTHCCVPVFPRKKLFVFGGRSLRSFAGRLEVKYITLQETPAVSTAEKKFGNPSSKHNPSILTKKDVTLDFKYLLCEKKSVSYKVFTCVVVLLLHCTCWLQHSGLYRSPSSPCTGHGHKLLSTGKGKGHFPPTW